MAAGTRLETNAGKQEEHWEQLEGSGQAPQEASPDQQKGSWGVRGPCVSPAGETVGEAEQLERSCAKLAKHSISSAGEC